MKTEMKDWRCGISPAHEARLRFRPTVILALAAMALVLPGAAQPALAETHESSAHTDDGGHEGGRRGSGSGGSGGHEDGHEEGDHDDGHEAGGPRGKAGSGGGHEDGGHDTGGHDAAGGGGGGERGAAASGAGNGGSGQRGDAGGKPVWAQEGIPEVELGRLNVARSPRQVIDRAFNEALASFTPEVAAFYRLDIDAMERELSENWANVRIIDSPLQNLALMRDALDGSSVLAKVGITTANDTLLAAFLGTASDKGIPISAETAASVAAILGSPLTPAEATALAEQAERIRQAILEGHG
jgi:hypothetical protein